MNKTDKPHPTNSPETVKKTESSVSLELLLDKSLSQKLNESARNEGLSRDNYILEILTKRFKKR